MRFRPIVLAVFLSAPSPAAPPASPQPPAPGPGGAWCNAGGMYRHAGERPRAEARRLDELPPGSLYLTVWRRSGDCVGPVLVRQGYGPARGDRR